jgi:transposase
VRPLPEGPTVSLQSPVRPLEEQTFIAGLRYHGLTARFFVGAPMNRRIFETYVEARLVPALEKGDVVILDNLSAHKSPVAEKAIRAKSAWILFLPPYSPDLNPIEMAFAKLKAHLRRRAIRTIDALWQAIGQGVIGQPSNASGIVAKNPVAQRPSVHAAEHGSFAARMSFEHQRQP